jgi:hypothetical protein
VGSVLLTLWQPPPLVVVIFSAAGSGVARMRRRPRHWIGQCIITMGISACVTMCCVTLPRKA